MAWVQLQGSARTPSKALGGRRAVGSLGCAFLAQVRQLERSIALKDLALAEMEHTIQEMEAASYDGIFIWKISDFARKRQEAVAGRSPAIFSPGGESHLGEHPGSDLGWGAHWLQSRERVGQGRATQRKLLPSNCLLLCLASLLHQQVRLQDVPADLPQWGRHRAWQPPLSLLRGNERAQ